MLSADIFSLQEVETEQFYNFFLPELKRDGYEGIFSAKSRAKTMQETERKHVDGCAIFWRTGKFSLLKEHLVEFNQVGDSVISSCVSSVLVGPTKMTISPPKELRYSEIG